MTRHYSSLADSKYLPKFLALHESLEKHSSEPHLMHFLALDMDAFWLLVEMKLPNVEVIPLEPFESAMKLQQVRKSRTWQEYAWTLASSFMEYLLPWYDSICYLDADIYFYSDPKAIFDEVGERSIGITPHRFNDRDRRRLGGNGEFNVGVVVAQNSPVGLECISRWAGLCREWCFNRNETGRFGDQKYLDDFEARYGEEVCVLNNLGVNLGPWSIGNFDINERGGSVYVNEYELVCFHFHEFIDGNSLTNWKLRQSDRDLVYRPYISAWLRASDRVGLTRREAELERLANQAERA